jgi:hypothetical protein
VWKELITRAETERAVFCNHLDGKALFTAALHRELRDTVLPVPVETRSSEEFRELRRRKRNRSDDKANKPKNSVPTPE